MTKKSLLGTWWGIFYPIVIYYIFVTVVNYVAVNVVFVNLAREGKVEYTQEALTKWATSNSLFLTLAAAVLIMPVLFVSYFRDQKKNETVFQPQKKVIWWIVLLVTAVGLGIFLNNVIAISGISEVFKKGQELNDSLYNAGMGWELLASGLLVPITEELIFRGLIYRRIRKILPIHFSYVFSALLFAFFHGNMVQGIYAFGCGLLFAYFYEKYETLLAPVLAHCAVNTASILITETSLKYLLYETKIRTLTVTALAGLAAVIGIIQIRKRLKPAKELPV